MADPKYADLPGIAFDEPDVYETSDLPESDQPVDFYEEENETIERIHLHINDAYNKFRNKFLNTQNADFSFPISKKASGGYDAYTVNWELANNEQESPLQKYQRLQCEMNELLEEINKVKASKNEENLNYVVSGEQVEKSLKQLMDLKLEETLGSVIMSKLADPQGTQIKKLISQLEQFKDKVNEKHEQQGDLDGSNITYQFTYKPEQSRLAQTSRIASLEGRLHTLESLIGNQNENLSRLAAATNKESLLETAQHLSATASLLDSSQLDHIEGRLSALAQKLDTISEKKKELAQDEEKDKMILELYELVKNSESISKLLPQTIERLKSLEALHNKATHFTKTIMQMEVLQSEIIGNVQNNKTLLQGVQESFANNLNEINQTVLALDARIKALKKK